MTATDDQIRTAIAEQAADWFVANQGDLFNEHSRMAFLRWLRTSPVHVEEYLGIATIARDLRTAGADPQASLQSLLAQARLGATDRVAADPPLSPRKPLWRSAWTPVVAVTSAALATLVVGFVLFWGGVREPPGLSKSYQTVHGEHGLWRLVDGSSVQLNTESTIRVRFTRAERTVELTRGRAFFQVAHDVRRRFRVSVDGADVVA